MSELHQPQLPQALLVIWRDCETLEGWHEIPTVLMIAERHRIIHTIGFEIGSDDDQLVLSSSHESEFGKVCGVWMIPRSQIVEIRKIDLPCSDWDMQ